MGVSSGLLIFLFVAVVATPTVQPIPTALKDDKVEPIKGFRAVMVKTMDRSGKGSFSFHMTFSILTSGCQLRQNLYKVQ